METFLEPLGDRVVIVPEEAAKMSAGGLFIPDIGVEPPSSGRVSRIGPEAVDCSFRVDGLVLFSRYSGVEFEEGGRKRIVVRAKDIIGTMRMR